MQQLALLPCARQRFFDDFRIGKTGTVKSGKLPISMTPHAADCAHFGNGCIKPSKLFNLVCNAAVTNFDKVAHDGQMSVRHTAFMAAISMDHVVNQRHQKFHQTIKVAGIGTERGFGNDQTA